MDARVKREDLRDFGGGVVDSYDRDRSLAGQVIVETERGVTAVVSDVIVIVALIANADRICGGRRP
jgi:hypothetical protein